MMSSPITQNFGGWITARIPEGAVECKIKIIPLIGERVENIIKLVEAPQVTILTNMYHDGKVGLDSYDSYKTEDVKSKYGVKYTKDGNGQYIPNVIYTGYSPDKIRFEFKTSDKSVVKGLCRYNVTSSDNSKIDPLTIVEDQGVGYLEVPKPSKGDVTLTITDGTGKIERTDKVGG